MYKIQIVKIFFDLYKQFKRIIYEQLYHVKNLKNRKINKPNILIDFYNSKSLVVKVNICSYLNALLLKILKITF